MAEAPDIVKVVQDHTGYKLGFNDVIGICLDIETIGSCMTKNAMSELGAFAIRVGECDEKMMLGTFEGHMKIPEGCGFEERCEREFWDVHKVDEKKRVLACQSEPTDVMRAFVDWVHAVRNRYVGSDSAIRVRFFTDASYFDAGWVSLYLTKYADYHPLHLFFSSHEKTLFSPVLDTNAFYRGIMRATPSDELAAERGPDGWFSVDKAVRKALSIPDDEKPGTKHDHRAVNDATNIMMKYNIVLKYLNKGGQVRSRPDKLTLEDVANCMPHACTIYDVAKETVRATVVPSGQVLRLAGEEEPTIEVVDAGNANTVLCRIGAPKYTGLNEDPPDCPVIVSDFVARHLLETGFPHPIYSPDTSPAAVVRDDTGSVRGTTRLVLHV
jgi:hypothetical protein